MMRLFIALAVALSPCFAIAEGLQGKWLTEDGKGHVLFEECGSKLCGKIVWLKNPRDASGKPLVDGLNQNKSLRGRQILGLKLTELEPNGRSRWKGTIYNPEDGKSYKAEAAIQKDGSLLIKGCVLGGLFCDDQTWIRVN
jgi:uncharacterized protein (DUF2147 family)